MATKKISSKKTINSKKISKIKTKNSNTPEEKIDTRVKIQGQALSIMRDMAPAKLDGSEKDSSTAPEKSVEKKIETKTPSELKIDEGQAKEVSEDDSALSTVKPSIAKEISIIAKDRTKELEAKENESTSGTKDEPEDNYSPEVLSDLSHDDKAKHQAPVIWIVVLIIIIVILIGLIVNWYLKQYGSPVNKSDITNALSTTEENFSPSINSQGQSEADQKIDELNATLNELDTDELTREPTINLNISE